MLDIGKERTQNTKFGLPIVHQKFFCHGASVTFYVSLIILFSAVSRFSHLYSIFLDFFFFLLSSTDFLTLRTLQLFLTLLFKIILSFVPRLSNKYFLQLLI